jgi:DNA (cytosine-5)-methyltransferase 1
MNKPTVIDFFCGAGGFSEGFRQQGFEIVAGYDNWKPAVETFSRNFGKGKGNQKNILDFEHNIELIESLPDANVILGSPPCVSFSSSNNSGKADKSMGIRLIKTFLKIVAVKKHRKESKLQAWFMENVVQSIDHIAKDYTFNELELTEWAKTNRIDPKIIAVSLTENHTTLNAASYGAPQQRIRAVAGEIFTKGGFVVPKADHAPKGSGRKLKEYISLGQIKKKLPAPNSKKREGTITDPLYQHVSIDFISLTDQFYDTGLYECEWRNSQYQKINHPYMGRMSFPENEGKPSRTITATKIGTSREAIIYKSEYRRTGSGEYRTPTVRESACLMSFPITYQFIGGESTKCKLVGNAVCPSVSRALARTLRAALGLPKIIRPLVNTKADLQNLPNLNNFKPKSFNTPPVKKKGARFRRHPFKDGNITVTLSNYDILKKQTKKSVSNVSRWITSVQYGNGNGFPCRKYQDGYYKELEGVIKTFDEGAHFLKVINNGFTEKIASKKLLQEIHEEQKGKDGFYTPTELIDAISFLIAKMDFNDPDFIQDDKKIFIKPVVPKKQVLALYAINKICSIVNSRDDESTT